MHDLFVASVRPLTATREEGRIQRTAVSLFSVLVLCTAWLIAVNDVFVAKVSTHCNQAGAGDWAEVGQTVLFIVRNRSSL